MAVGIKFLPPERTYSSLRIGEFPCRLLRTKNHHFAALRVPDFQRMLKYLSERLGAVEDEIHMVDGFPMPICKITRAAKSVVVYYLRALIEDKRTDILFVGYQAEGTAGRIIQKYGAKNGYVTMDGQLYNINAGVYTLSGCSAHADQATLLRFVKRMRIRPKEIRLVHGDKHAKSALQGKLQQAYSGIDVWIP